MAGVHVGVRKKPDNSESDETNYGYEIPESSVSGRLLNLSNDGSDETLRFFT